MLRLAGVTKEEVLNIVVGSYGLRQGYWFSESYGNGKITQKSENLAPV